MKDAVKRHYDRDGLLQKIDDALVQSGIAPLRPTLADLSPYDEMHIGGHAATVDFVSRLGLKTGMSVLDIGAGLGGVARYVAHETGANVVGVDLSDVYCDVAAELSRRVGLGTRTIFRQGDATAPQFATASFHAAYTIHVAMNIADKLSMYRGVHSVLAPGGVFGIYDILAGSGSNSGAGTLNYPMPWAPNPEISHLATPDEMRAMLTVAGFEILTMEDRTAHALATGGKKRARGIPPALLQVKGPEFPAAVENLAAALENGACAPWIFVARRV